MFICVTKYNLSIYPKNNLSSYIKVNIIEISNNAMIKAKCLISQSHDPWFNLATEDWIFKDLSAEEHILFLWRNEKTVVIGRNQNPWAECDLKKMEDNQVKLVRRQSGGGAVFQDLGNTNFTFLSSRSNYDRKRNFDIIINALGKFGIKAEQSGRNDILVNGVKVSGSAFKENPDRAFHHGTLLINVNLGELAQYLTPSQKKLLSKGTTSVRSRVANLTEFNKDISHNVLSEAIIDEFFKTHNAEKKIEILDNNSLQKIPEINNYYEELKSHAWILGETPQFTTNLSERFDWGMIDLHLNAEKGKISKVKIFSDALHTELVDILQSTLKGLELQKEVIQNNLNKLKDNHPELTQNIEDFSNWFCKEI